MIGCIIDARFQDLFGDNNMSWLVFAVLAYFLFSTTNIIDKIVSSHFMKDAIGISIVFGLIDFVVGVLLALAFGISIASPIYVLSGIAAGFCEGFAFIPYIKSMSMEDASTIAPLSQLIPLFVLILSAIFLKEHLIINQYGAFALLMIGSLLLSIEKGSGKMVFSIRKAFWYMIVSDIIFAIENVLVKNWSSPIDIWQIFIFQRIGVGICRALMCFVPSIRSVTILEFKNIKLLNLSVMVLDDLLWTSAVYLSYQAIARGSASLVTALIGLQLVFTFILEASLSLFFPKIMKSVYTLPSILLKICAIALIFGGVWTLQGAGG